MITNKSEKRVVEESFMEAKSIFESIEQRFIVEVL